MARNIAAELGRRQARPFEYRSSAAFVNLGRYKAVGRIGRRTFRGFPAWWLARTYHMSQIPGAARKVAGRHRLDGQPALPPRSVGAGVDRAPEPAGGDNGATPGIRVRRSCAFFFGLATAIIGRGKGSSFWLWLLIGTVLPPFGLVAVILYRSEKQEPERQCPRCGKAVKLYVQVCSRCGEICTCPTRPRCATPGSAEPAVGV